MWFNFKPGLWYEKRKCKQYMQLYNMFVSEVANSYVNYVLSDSGITRGYADTVGFRNVPGNEIWSIYNPNNYTKYIMKLKYSL